MLISSPAPPEITATLGVRERVLWSGQPRQGLTLRASDGYLIPFSLVWCAFVSFWEWSVLHSGAPVFMRLWGIPFILIGLYLVVGRFFVDAALRRSTLYAVTDERILIIAGIWSRETTSLQLRTLEQVSLSANASGVGTITFGRGSAQNRYGMFGTLPGWPGARRVLPPMFELIPDAPAVANLIRDNQQTAK